MGIGDIFKPGAIGTKSPAMLATSPPGVVATRPPPATQQQEAPKQAPQVTASKAKAVTKIDTAEQKRRELLTKRLPGGFTRFQKYDYTGPKLTDEQKKYINTDNLATRYHGPSDPERVYDLTDPDNPVPVTFVGGLARPDVKYVVANGKPLDVGTLFPTAEPGPVTEYQGREWDWSGWGAAGEGGKPVKLTREGSGEQTPIIEGTPQDKEYQAELAAQKVIDSGKPIRLDDMPADVARKVTEHLQRVGIDAIRDKQTLETWDARAANEWERNMALKALSPYGNEKEGYLLGQFALDKGRDDPDMLQTLKAAGFKKAGIDKAREWARQEEQRQNKLQYEAPPGEEPKRLIFLPPPGAVSPDYPSQVWQSITPWDESKGETVTVKGAVTMAGEMLVPGVYTKSRWNELTAPERAFSIALDAVTAVAMILPVVGAGAAGARAVATSGRVARLAGAAKGVGQAALAQAQAPVDMVIHPVRTAKMTGVQIREFVENLAHPKKLPQAVITTTDGTVRLRVSETTTPEQAKAIRDRLMELAAKGERPVVTVGGTKVELSRSPLMKEVKGGVVHTTPQGEAFKASATVAEKPSISATEQGLFVSNEPLPRFTTSSAFGKTGESPSIIILSGDTAGLAVPSGKIYRGTVEMELKFPVGTKIPSPKQVLFTRVGVTGQRVEILLEKPLTVRQIAKLKALDLVEQIKTPFKPAIAVERVGKGQIGLTAEQITSMGKILSESGNGDVVRQLVRVDEYAGRVRWAAKPLSSLGIRGLLVGEQLGRIDRSPKTGRFESQPLPGRVSESVSRASPAPEASREQLELERAELERLGRAGLRRTSTSRAAAMRTDREPATVPARNTTERIPSYRLPVDAIPPERVLSERTPPERTTPLRIPSERLPPTRTPRARATPPRNPPPRTPPLRPPPPERMPPPPPPTSGEDAGESKQKEWTTEQIRQAVGWKQGMGYRVWTWPFEDETRDFRWFSEPPKGMKIALDAKTAAKTIQSLYGNKIKKAFIDRMGFETVTVRSATGEPGHGKIEFERAVALERPKLSLSRSSVRITPRRPKLR